MLIKSSFETILPKRIKNQWFWSVIAVIAFFTSSLLLSYYGEESYLVTRTFLVLSPCLWPIVYSIIAKKFHNQFIKNIRNFFLWDESQSNNWYKAIATKAFCLKKSNLFFTCVLWVWGIYTVYSMPLPFKANMINNIGRLGILLPVFIGVHAVPMIFYCVKALYELTKIEISEHFYSCGYQLLQSIKNFYMGFAVTIAGLNLSLFLGFYYSPYGFNEFSIIWIAFISIWPVTMYISTQYFIKIIENRSKKVYLDLLNQHVISPSLDKLITAHQNEDFEDVKRNIEFRDSLLQFNGRKKDFTSALTLFTTVLAGSFQIIITIISLKP